MKKAWKVTYSNMYVGNSILVVASTQKEALERVERHYPAVVVYIAEVTNNG